MKEAVRQMYLAVKTKRHAPGMTLFEYWIWRMNRVLKLPK
jgi:hypothetical protein